MGFLCQVVGRSVRVVGGWGFDTGTAGGGGRFLLWVRAEGRWVSDRRTVLTFIPLVLVEGGCLEWGEAALTLGPLLSVRSCPLG